MDKYFWTIVYSKYMHLSVKMKYEYYEYTNLNIKRLLYYKKHIAACNIINELYGQKWVR